MSVLDLPINDGGPDHPVSASSLKMAQQLGPAPIKVNIIWLTGIEFCTTEGMQETTVCVCSKEAGKED